MCSSVQFQNKIDNNVMKSDFGYVNFRYIKLPFQTFSHENSNYKIILDRLNSMPYFYLHYSEKTA